MRRWLWVVVFGLLFFLFGVAAATVSRWGPPLWKALDTQADPIQSLAGIITVVLTAAALVAALVSIARAKRPPREEARGQSQPRPSEPHTVEASGPDAVAMVGNVIIHAQGVQVGGTRQTTAAIGETGDAAAPQVTPGGALPSVWNVPHRRNPYFTGRDDLLERLRKQLASGKPAAAHGLGGVGKTQLAVEYAYRSKEDYDIVWWVRAEEPATRAADYAELARALALPEKDLADQTRVVEAVRRHLEGRGRWLLIFDNAPGPKYRAPEDRGGKSCGQVNLALGHHLGRGLR